AGQIPVPSSQSTAPGGLSTTSRFFLRIYSQVARSPRLFALSQKVAALGTRLLSPFSHYVRLPAFTGWGYSKDLPRFAGKTFRERFHREGATAVQTFPETRSEELRDLPPVVVQTDKVAQFIEELIKVNGNVTRVDLRDVTDKIIEFLKARGLDAIHLEPNLLDEAVLQNAGIAARRAPDPALRVGATKAICGLADTGSILVADGEGYSLHASLLPRIHIAVLCRSAILPALADALTLPVVLQAKSAVVITGPSRTADIEMSLTIGMHGPGELHVFLVDD
ncbi:MAG: LUD domain-containing protein, partial [Anaerolineales bacterium]